MTHCLKMSGSDHLAMNVLSGILPPSASGSRRVPLRDPSKCEKWPSPAGVLNTQLEYFHVSADEEPQKVRAEPQQRFQGGAHKRNSAVQSRRSGRPAQNEKKQKALAFSGLLPRRQRRHHDASCIDMPQLNWAQRRAFRNNGERPTQRRDRNARRF